MFKFLFKKSRGPTLALETVMGVSLRDRKPPGQRHLFSQELLAAVQHGRKVRARPGRDGGLRWRFEYQGIAVVTDANCKQEITSWRLDGEDEEFELPQNLLAAGSSSSHTVLIVDNSGSMRQEDVLGYHASLGQVYMSRTAAVYDCLAQDFVEPQLGLNRTLLDAAGNELGTTKAVVSLIEMSDTAEIVLERCPLEDSLLDFMLERKAKRAASHGNYLPALEALDQLLTNGDDPAEQLFVVFLSDGVPSDSHTAPRFGRCLGIDDNGTKQRFTDLCYDAFYNPNAGSQHQLMLVESACLKQIQALGDRYGQDRLSLHTVAFGPEHVDYRVLQGMAKALPRSSFHKLGLNCSKLRDAFSSITSTLTSLRTQLTGDAMTLRTIQRRAAQSSASGKDADLVQASQGWQIYLGVQPGAAEGGTGDVHRYSIVSKQRYDYDLKQFVDAPLQAGATGLAVMGGCFACGVEHAVFDCTELLCHDGVQGRAVGERLVAKESVYVGQLDASFHTAIAKLQAQAQYWAQMFNQKVSACLGVSPAHHLEFLQCHVYKILSDTYDAGHAWILAEPYLDGRWHKWNNNTGGVRKARLCTRADRDRVAQKEAQTSMAAILEEKDGDGQQEAGDGEGQKSAGTAARVELADVPQCFSHFTWSTSGGKKLVCDLQGTWNEVDGFILTDPVIHSLQRKNGPTDRGQQGMTSFFLTHQCGALCRLLGLPHSTGPGGHGVRPLQRKG